MARINVGSHVGDLYQLLGVESDASAEDIGRAYRRLARRYHPDVDSSPRAAERFIALTHAYRTLADPAARVRYDARLARRHSADDDPRVKDGDSTSPGAMPWNRGRPSFSGAEPLASWLGEPRSTSEAFHIGGATWVAPGGEEADVEISVEEAYLGAFRSVTVTGQGRTDTAGAIIPPGAISGERIVVSLSHIPGSRGVPEVFLRVRIMPHRRYRVDGRDVHIQLPLSPWEAALGATATTHIPTGPVTISVPPCTSTGDVLTVPGAGLPNPSGPPGSLYVEARIVLPTQLTATECELFSRLARTSAFSPRTD